MDTTSSRKHIFGIRILTVTLLVCAWLLPTSVGIASSASGNTKVTLAVEDAVGVNYGASALDSGSVSGAGQVTTEVVTRMASSRLNGGMATVEARGMEESVVVVTVSSL